MDETVNYCSQCSTELIDDEVYPFDSEIYCEDCIDDKTFICTHCNERFQNDDNSGDDDTPLCEHCYDYHYNNCGRCGSIISDNDVYYAEDDTYNENPYFYECYDYDDRVTYLHSYSYKPKPIFYGDGIRYFGVELEIDRGGKDERNAKVLCNLSNRHNENIYIKTDGSLDNGMEIVTHPMNLEYHMKEMPWKLLIERALELEYLSHKAETCGLHVHVNRNSFSDNRDFQDECIGRILYIIERFWQEMLRFSRRTETQLEKWARRYGYKECPADILDTAKKNCSGRYYCVIFRNKDFMCTLQLKKFY